MKNIRLVAFDCDGVMFDTKVANTSYYNEILRFIDKPPLVPEQFEFVHMHTVDESLAFLIDDPVDLEKAGIHRKAMSYMPFVRDMIIEPHLKPLLKKLKTRVNTAIATNRTDTMDHVLKTHVLEDCFDLVVTALDVENPKPHPEALVRILRHFDLKPREMIYIGDSKLDEMAAKAALVPFVAYDNTSLSADYHVTGLSEIEALLE
jgi:phosphoglycolate phosphatase